MTQRKADEFLFRIDQLTVDHKPSFGKMNVHQMVCHCTDFFRMAKGTKKAKEYGVVNPDTIKSLAKAGKPTPTPKGFGQVEGDGTKPTDFEKDRRVLKDCLLEFSKLPIDFDFAPHPYFGEMKYSAWTSLAAYHMNHHLEQFNV